MTPQGLSAERLDQIRARLNATSRDWQSKHDFDRDGMLTIVGNVDGEYVDGVPECTFDLICEVEDGKDAVANAIFIGSAQNDISALLSEVTRLRALADGMAGALGAGLTRLRMIGTHFDACELAPKCTCGLDEIRATVETVLSTYDSDKAGK